MSPWEATLHIPNYTYSLYILYFPTDYIVPCDKPKGDSLLTNDDKTYSQCTEGDPTSILHLFLSHFSTIYLIIIMACGYLQWGQTVRTRLPHECLFFPWPTWHQTDLWMPSCRPGHENSGCPMGIFHPWQVDSQFSEKPPYKNMMGISTETAYPS